ncbi:hypothetical protein KR044_006414 [Drosophila immigrans]|nr:hypothetical protein KR044_006414 [Drosophila immigrans]
MEHHQNKTEFPEWLDQNLFTEFLKQDFPNFKSLNQFDVEQTCGKGENFTTLVLRVNLGVNLADDSQVATSYIVKLLPTTLSTRDMISSWKVFEKEKLSYSQYVPDFEHMYAKANKKIRFGAKYYEMNGLKGEEIIVLEDLRNQGFKNCNRQRGLDMDHTQSVLEKLAQFHAASAVHYELKGPYPDLYDRNLCSEEDKFEEFRATQAKSLIDALSHFGAEHLKSALKTYASRAPDMYQAIASKFDNEFRCVNHGDFYCNNIMFQYDENGKISETYFIDLQMSRYCSPAQDLIYFLLSSVSIDLKLSKFDYFISFYHSKLIENLKLLQYGKDLPKLRDLHVAIFNHGDWAYPVISLLLPLVLIDPNEKSNMDTLMDQENEGNHFRNTLFSNPRVIQHYKLILPWAYNRGLFEYKNNEK